METESYVNPYRLKKTSVYFKEKREKQVINLNNKESFYPKRTLCIKVPRVEDALIVPGTIALSFDMKIILPENDSKTALHVFPVNNLAASIIFRYIVNVGTQTVFDLDKAYLYIVYKDMWLSKKSRKNAVFKGIQNISLRKRRVKRFNPDGKEIDDTITSGFVVNVDEKILIDVYKNRYIIPLDFKAILNYMPLLSDLEVNFKLTISEIKYVLNYPDAAKRPSFRIKKLKLEYETVRDKQLQQEISNALTAGVQFFFDRVYYYDRVFNVKKEDKEFSATISDVARKSSKGLLLIFEDDFEKRRRNLDRFINQRIKETKICMGGEVAK